MSKKKEHEEEAAAEPEVKGEPKYKVLNLEYTAREWEHICNALAATGYAAAVRMRREIMTQLFPEQMAHETGTK